MSRKEVWKDRAIVAVGAALILAMIVLSAWAEKAMASLVNVDQRGNGPPVISRSHVNNPPSFTITEGNFTTYSLNDSRDLSAYKGVGTGRVDVHGHGAYTFYYFEVWPAYDWAWFQVDADFVFSGGYE